MADHLYLSTRKGLMIYARNGKGWVHKSSVFLGSPVSISLTSADNNTVFAALNLGHFGVKLHRSTDGGATWTEVSPPAFPKVEGGDKDEKAPAVADVWSLAWADPKNPKALWAGCAPAGLFYSSDLGESWTLNENLWNMPERANWFGGGTVNTALHSICVDPRSAKRVAIGVSCGGVTLTEDGGKTWSVAGHGLRNEYTPPDQAQDPVTQDVHLMVQSPTSPDNYWIQHHNGIFRSTDNLKSWVEVTNAPVSHFGFPVAVHPKDPNTAWFVPAKKDEQRYPVDGNVVVNRTRDGAKTFTTLRRGLPQGNAFDLIYRHGLAVDETGECLAMGSTTGAVWTSDNGDDDWTLLSAHLPPVYAVKMA
ncbi:MAG: exo-alpha-sialidase [Rhodospirillaceae bacterium]|nr:exo-alpha-sialidase [Rhodospirillaceae bacterium]